MSYLEADMTTLREELNAAGFDWDNGRIIYQAVEDDSSPGWAMSWELHRTREVTSADAILDMEFDDGYGGPEMPRFFASDGAYLYFPAQYDGSTWVERMVASVDYYLQHSLEPLPYAGS